LLAGIQRPSLLVDWSDAELRRRWLMIKAAVAVGGRAVSVYEQVYPMSRYNSPKTHRQFLLALKGILPDGCKPIQQIYAQRMQIEETSRHEEPPVGLRSQLRALQ
jgi:hypothetical protein